jgi:hypothetical protein
MVQDDCLVLEYWNVLTIVTSDVPILQPLAAVTMNLLFGLQGVLSARVQNVSRLYQLPQHDVTK